MNAWLVNALSVSDSALPEFANKYVYERRSRSLLVNKWIKGSSYPTLRSVERVDLALPGTREVFEHPLFSLLSQDTLSEREIRKVLRGHIQPEGSWFGWEFPNDELIRNTRNWRPVGLVWDTNNLVERRDLWGFTAIVATVRLAEAQGKDLLHMQCCMDMYRALPAALMTPWLRSHIDLLVECLNHLRHQRVVSIIHFSVDWEAIRDQTMRLLARSAEELTVPATFRVDSDVIHLATLTPSPAILDIRTPSESFWSLFNEEK